MGMKNNPARPTSYISLDETSRALIFSSVESAYVMDNCGYVLAANDAAARLHGFKTGSELEQQNIFSLLPDDVAKERKARINDIVLTAKPLRFEEEVQGKALLHSIVPVPNPWGEVSRMAVSIQDQTELRRTDEDLRREQQRQIFFMESLPGIVYHLYPDKSIRYANRYFRKYFGSPRGRLCHDALLCSSDDCDGCPPMDAMEMDRAVEWDWTDNQGRTFHLQCSPMTDSSGERMIMVLGIDITARKQAEDDLKQAHGKLEDRVLQRTKELERANTELTSKSMRLIQAMKRADAATRAKSSFLANMSHEIRTPLNAVLGMTELALRSDNDQERNDFLKRVMEAGNSLLSVINDILDFSKIEARKLTLEKIDFNLSKTLDAALDIHRLHATDKGLNLTYSIGEHVPTTLKGDPSRLKQVLINLLSNAVKFTEIGGVNVDVSLVQGSQEQTPGEDLTLRFAVSDTGIGIPEDKQKAVFESFLQADESVTRKHGGTGLGLAICTLLVELMQGQIALESVEDQGSTFSFTARLQVGNAENVPADMADNSIESLGKQRHFRVLLADDNALNRHLASTLLKEQGHECVSVENGALALEAVKQEHFDVILMDVQMPIMDGVTATRAIRDQNSGALNPAIPIVAITAHALKGDKERFLGAGMNDYIAKPIIMAEFYATLNRVMESAPPSMEVNETPQHEQDHPEAFDRANAMEMLAGRQDLLNRMDEIFLRDVPKEMNMLLQHMENHEWDDARRLAHSIKGSSRTVGAQRAGAVAEQLEFFCRQKDTSSAENHLKTLESEVKNALEFIKDELNNIERPANPEGVV